jgi:hypothetical protein
MVLLIRVFFYKCGHRNVLSKRQVWMSIFHIINFKKKKFMDTGSWIFFNKKLILDYYFCLKSGPVFLFQIFIIAPSPLGYKIVSLIINSDFLFKINLIYKTTDICSIFNADLSFSRNKFLFFALNCRNITFI